jgi:hypothetical protein
MELTAGARLTERRGIGGPLGRREPKGKTYSREDTRTRGLGGPVGTVLACGGSEASGLAGPEAGWAARLAGPKLRKKGIYELKIGFFEFTKALEICRRRFRRNFDMRIFPKFF